MANVKPSDTRALFVFYNKPHGIELYLWNRAFIGLSHFLCVSYVYLLLCQQLPRSTVVFILVYSLLSVFGTCVGYYMCWSHQPYRISPKAKILLLILKSMTFQWPIYNFCLDHRMHHHYFGTDADPYNAKRGAFFSYIGWLLSPKHPDYTSKRNSINMSDLERDLIIRFECRWYTILALTFHLSVSVLAFYFFWGLPFTYSFACHGARFVFSVHMLLCLRYLTHTHKQ